MNCLAWLKPFPLNIYILYIWINDVYLPPILYWVVPGWQISISANFLIKAAFDMYYYNYGLERALSLYGACLGGVDSGFLNAAAISTFDACKYFILVIIKLNRCIYKIWVLLLFMNEWLYIALIRLLKYISCLKFWESVFSTQPKSQIPDFINLSKCLSFGGDSVWRCFHQFPYCH